MHTITRSEDTLLFHDTKSYGACLSFINNLRECVRVCVELLLSGFWTDRPARTALKRFSWNKSHFALRKERNVIHAIQRVNINGSLLVSGISAGSHSPSTVWALDYLQQEYQIGGVMKHETWFNFFWADLCHDICTVSYQSGDIYEKKTEMVCHWLGSRTPCILLSTAPKSVPPTWMR